MHCTRNINFLICFYSPPCDWYETQNVLKNVSASRVQSERWLCFASFYYLLIFPFTSVWFYQFFFLNTNLFNALDDSDYFRFIVTTFSVNSIKWVTRFYRYRFRSVLALKEHAHWIETKINEANPARLCFSHYKEIFIIHCSKWFYTPMSSVPVKQTITFVSHFFSGYRNYNKSLNH